MKHTTPGNSVSFPLPISALQAHQALVHIETRSQLGDISHPLESPGDSAKSSPPGSPPHPPLSTPGASLSKRIRTNSDDNATEGLAPRLKRPTAVRPSATDIADSLDGPEGRMRARFSEAIQFSRAMNRQSQEALRTHYATLGPELVQLRLRTAYTASAEPQLPSTGTRRFIQDVKPQNRTVYRISPVHALAVNVASTSNTIPPTPPITRLPLNDDVARQGYPAAVYIGNDASSWLAFMHSSATITSADIQSSEAGNPKRRSWGTSDHCFARLNDRYCALRRLQPLLVHLHEHGILSPQRGDDFVPHELSTLFESLCPEGEANVRAYIAKSFLTENEAITHLQGFENALARAAGLLDIAFLHAIDISAILAGRELPLWPSESRWRGGYVYPHDLDNSEAESDLSWSFSRQLRAVERWGLPLWCYKTGTRIWYDVNPLGRPSGVDAVDNQLWLDLRKLSKSVGSEVHDVRTVTSSQLVNDPTQPKCAGLPPVDSSERRSLGAALVNFLHPASATPLTLLELNHALDGVLDRAIWPPPRHEANLHSRTPSSSREAWTTVRDAYLPSFHLGIAMARFTIPSAWYDINSYVADRYGFDRAPEVSKARLEPLPMRTWHGLEIDDFPSKLGEAMTAARDQALSAGAYGWSASKSLAQFKDSEGKTIPNSRFKLALVFKEQGKRNDFHRAFASSFPSHSLTTSTLNDVNTGNFNWSANPHFVDRVFFFGCDEDTRSRLLQSPPSYPMPEPHAAEGVSTVDAEVNVTQALRFSEFLLSNSLPPQPSSSTTSRARRVQDECKTTLDKFVSIAFAVDENSRLTPHLRTCLQRCACILHVLGYSSRKAFFRTLVFSPDLLAVLRFVGDVIRSTSGHEGTSFQSLRYRSALTPFVETFQMRADNSIIFHVAVDDHTPHPPTADDLLVQAGFEETSRTQLSKGDNGNASNRQRKKKAKAGTSKSVAPSK